MPQVAALISSNSPLSALVFPIAPVSPRLTPAVWKLHRSTLRHLTNR
jgi:hypothetical protein